MDDEHDLGRAGTGRSRAGDAAAELPAGQAGDAPGREPSASIPQACRGWAEMRAAYRFTQDKVDWQDILQPHWDATAQHAREHPVVLCLQDTTELDFEGKAPRAAGSAELRGTAGMYLHPDPCGHARAGCRWA